MRLMSFCNPVKSYSRGGRSRTVLRCTENTWNVKSGASTILLSFSASARSSNRPLASVHPPIGTATFQNGFSTWPAICLSRSATIVSVGVCTRPPDMRVW